MKNLKVTKLILPNTNSLFDTVDGKLLFVQERMGRDMITINGKWHKVHAVTDDNSRINNIKDGDSVILKNGEMKTVKDIKREAAVGVDVHFYEWSNGKHDVCQINDILYFVIARHEDFSWGTLQEIERLHNNNKINEGMNLLFECEYPVEHKMYKNHNLKVESVVGKESNELYKREQQHIQELNNDSAELASLKQTILESDLKNYFPKRDMSFHDKVLFAIAEVCDLKNKEKN